MSRYLLGSPGEALHLLCVHVLALPPCGPELSPSLECLTRLPADDSPQNGLVPRIAQMSSANWRKSFVGSVEGRPLGSLRDVWFQGDCEIGTIATKARDSDHLGRVGGPLTWAEWGYRSLHLIGGADTCVLMHA